MRFRLAPVVRLPLFVSSLSLLACGARSALQVDSSSQGGAGASGSSGITSSTHASTVTTVGSTSTTSSASTGSGTLMGPPISPSGFSDFEAETSIVIDPVSKRLGAAWIAVGGGGQGSSMGYAFSLDGGTKWTMPSNVVAPGGRDSSDPVLAVDAAGAFYMAFVAFHRDQMGNPLDMHVYVSKSAPGSTSFGPPIEVTDPNASALLYDKPWITVTKAGTIAVSYADVRNDGYSEAIALSTDGVNWTRSHIGLPNAGNFFNLNFLCPDLTTGRLHAALLGTDPMGAHVKVLTSHSDDQGHTWSMLSEVAGALTTNEEVAFDDPTCFAQNGQVVVVYGVANGPPPSTSDSQSSFGLRLAELDGNNVVKKRMNVEDPASGKAFQHATIAGDASGRLAIAYYAGQFDEDMNGSYRVGSLGTIAAVSVHPTVPFDSPIFTTVQRASQQWLGDYTGLVVDSGTAYTTFVTNETAPTSQISFTKLKLP